MTFPISFGARPAVARFLEAALVLCAVALPAYAQGRTDAAASVHADDARALRDQLAIERRRAPAPRLDRRNFLATPALSEVQLGPDGRHLAYLRQDGPGRGLWLLPTAVGSRPQRLLANTDATQLAWSRNGQWLFLRTPNALQALALSGRGSRIVSALGGRSHRRFIDIDPSQPAAALVLEEPRRGAESKHWRLWRVAADGHQQLLREDAAQIVDVAMEADGRVAFVLHAQGDHHRLHRFDAAGRRVEVARCTQARRCLLLGSVNGGRELWMRGNLGGNFDRPFRIDAGGGLHTLHTDPRGQADVDTLVLDPVTRAPLVASYRSIQVAHYPLTAQAKARLDVIERRFGPRIGRLQAGHGEHAPWLVHERADTLRGERLHVFDPTTGRFHAVLADAAFVFDARPMAAPDESRMARKIAFSYRASDGQRVHGFVLVPPGVDPARAPLIANAHGGPFNHFRADFSNEAQFLANRGYVVFQSNFRGSTGLGRDYTLAGHGDFGNGRVQRDIVEGVQYLLAQGIGDPNRVGIVGTSFGGYSALLGVTFQPELFRVAVAAVPPGDLGWVLRDYARGSVEMIPGIPIATSMRHFGLDPADPALARRLTAQSPIANAARLRSPVLVLAGGEDDRVPIRGVLHYAAQLQVLRKDVSLFVDADAGHGLADMRTREAYFFLTESLLHARLGGRAPQPADRLLRAHLQRNLRLTGASLRQAGIAPPAGIAGAR